MDMQTDVRRTAGFAAIVQALLVTVPGRRVETPYDRELYARRRRDGRPPDPPDPRGGRGARLGSSSLALARRARASSPDLVLEGRPEAERQLELGMRRHPRAAGRGRADAYV